MAFQQYGLMGQEPTETDDERKRRLMLAASVFTGMPLDQAAGQYLTNRVGQATDAAQQFGQMLSNPQQALQQRMLGPVSPQDLEKQKAETITMPSKEANLPSPVQVAQSERVATDVQRPPVIPVMAGLQQQAQQMQPTEEPMWMREIREAQGDITKLHRIAGNDTYPDEARKLAGSLTNQLYARDTDTKKATETIEKFAQGDQQAISTLLKDIKKPEGSYLKAILYARLGLNELAKQEQDKLGQGERKYSPSMIDGQNYFVEYDSRGAPLRAWNNQGIAQKEDVVAKIAAGGIKLGTQAFGFTGEVGIVKDPITGQDIEVRQRTNAITGQIENIIVTGPNAGKPYSGTAIPQSKSVSTAMAKMDYGLITDLQKRHGGNVLDALKDFQSVKGPLNDVERQQFLQLYGYGTTVPGRAPAAQPAPAPVPAQPAVSQPIPTQQGRVAQPVIPGAPVTPGVPTTAGRPILTQPIGQLQSQQRIGEKAQTERIQTQEEAIRAEQKPPAEAKGKVAAKDVNNQAYADNVYTIIRPISDLIKQSTGSTIGAGVDKFAGAFGASTKGAQAIAELNVLSGLILNNVPRFEGPQSDRDVAEYMRQAGALNDASQPVKTRLAALNAIVTLLKKYDKAGKNDWSFGGGKTSTTADGRPIIKLD